MTRLWHALGVFEPWHLELFDECRVARLGTLNADGSPHLVPVCFALVAGQFAVAVDEKPKRAGTLARVANIQRDARATLLVDRYDDDWTRLAWVRADCLASVAPRGSGVPAALAALRSRYRQYETMDLESRPLLWLEPWRVRSWRWSE